MRDVVFYDFDFNRLAEFGKIISVNIEEKYCGYGAAELHFPISAGEIITLLDENPYLFFIFDKSAAVVTGFKIDEDITVFGRTPEWLLTKRGVEAFSRENALPETIARDAVTLGAGDFMALGEVEDFGEALNYSTSDVRVLYDVVCEVLNLQGLGFKVVPDIAIKKFIFQVLKGGESLCSFSMSDRTAYHMQYIVDRQSVVHGCGWYKQKYKDMGSWDAQNNLPDLSDEKEENAYTFYRISSPSYDLNGDRVYRFELWCTEGSYLYSDNTQGKWKISSVKPDSMWIYLGEPSETGAKRWDAVLSGTKTADEARAEIARMVHTENTEAEVKDVVYGVDYKLGDIVRVKAEFGSLKKPERKRVTAVNIYYDTDKSGVIPILSKEV